MSLGRRNEVWGFTWGAECDINCSIVRSRILDDIVNENLARLRKSLVHF